MLPLAVVARGDGVWGPGDGRSVKQAPRRLRGSGLGGLALCKAKQQVENLGHKGD